MDVRRNLRYLALTLGLLLPTALLAAIPRAIHVQAFLADSTGAAVTGSPSIRFCLYDSLNPTVTVALWCDTRTVTVDQGVLDVGLDEATTPFPATLFDNPLYLGIQVASDPEMTPRLPLASEAYAFKADDADTVGGQTAASLDQSADLAAHLADAANPHHVTTGQIGAAAAADLNAHLADTGNPHGVTTAQIGAVDSATFSAHTADSAAHHTRFTNTEARMAMGLKLDTNALNHDRYTDPEAVAAIKAADGSGSTLDADFVDGLHASEIITAAQDEVRTPINSLPITITEPGSYYLTGNLTATGGTGHRGIDIQTDNVALDLMGFTISGGGVNDTGIGFSGQDNITIRNGTVANFGLAGIYQGSTSAHYTTILDIKALNNGSLGASPESSSGIFIASANSHIERCVSGGNGGNGLYAGVNSKVINNTVYNNTGTPGTSGVYGGTGSIVSGNTAYSNTGTYAIYGGLGSKVSGNTAYSNTVTSGIYGAAGSTLIGNTAYSNTATYGLYGSFGAIISANAVRANTHWGMGGRGSNLIKDNTITFNNTSDTVGGGGLQVHDDSRVTGNTLGNNRQNNIVVNSSDNTIENNLVTDSLPGNGIYFSASGNFYANNRASGNTTNYAGSVPTGGGDGGGNASF